MTNEGTVVFEQRVDLSPASPLQHTVALTVVSKATALRLSVTSAEGVELVAYQPDDHSAEPTIPEPAIAAKAPADVENNEQLYLTGHHIEQYRHATYSATDYYEEALRRDPNDSRCANAMGLWYHKHGQFAKAEPYFRTAIKTLTARNPNPYDGEAYYNLGLCLTRLARYDDAFGAFFKATWNAAWQDMSFLELARIATRRGDYKQALELVERSLVRNGHGHSARHLNVALLRKMGKLEAARQLIDDTLAIDKFHFGCLFERVLLEQNGIAGLQPGTQDCTSARQELNHLMRQYVHNYLEYALDYSRAGLYDEAAQLLREVVSSRGPPFTRLSITSWRFSLTRGKLTSVMRTSKKPPKPARISYFQTGSMNSLCYNGPLRSRATTTPVRAITSATSGTATANIRKPSTPGSNRPN